MIRLTCFIVTVFLGFKSLSQDAKNVQFISINEQLTQNTVTSIIQDKHGFLWIGTRGGLNKYDGVNMVTYEYELDEPGGLRSGYIWTMLEDSKGTLWVGTFGGGLHQYDALNDSFKSYSFDKEKIGSISDNAITSIFEDHQQNLWVGTAQGGLNKLVKGTSEFIHYKQNKDDPFSLSHNYVTGITEDKEGNLWIGTWGGGLNLLDTKSSRFIHYTHHSKDKSSLSSNIIRSMISDNDGNLWLATQNGLNKVSYGINGRYNIERVKIDNVIDGKEFNIALSVLKDSNDKLWVGFENGGITVLDKNSKPIDHLTHNPKRNYGLSSNSIWSLYEDRTGTIWIGTFNQGLLGIDPDQRKFTHHKQNPYNSNSLSHNSVSSFAEDSEKNIWIGTDGGGLNYWNPRTNEYKHYRSSSNLGSGVSSDAVLSLLIDHDENLWIGTWQEGINVLRKGSKRFENFSLGSEMNEENEKGNIFSIIEDKKKRIWIAAFRSGLFLFDTKTGKIEKFSKDPSDPSSISSNFVRSLQEDANGNIWIGTERSGLNKLVENGGQITFERYEHNPKDITSISNNMIMSTLVDSKDRFWVGTSAGLNLMDAETGEFKRFGKKDGLSNEVIYGLLEDDSSNLWISTNKGLSKLNLIDLDIKNYDVSDGLQSSEFFKQSCYRRSNGELLFGGINGFNSFVPANVKVNTFSPAVYFKDFRISNKSVKPGQGSPLKDNLMSTKNISLNYDQNDFSFEFALISFSQSKNNVYAYQLINYDKTWQEIGNRRNATYTNVPPGMYEFRVKGTNSDGVWSDKIASVRINISPAWYNTYWAYSIYFITFIALFAWGIRTIVNRERLQTRLKVEHMELSKMQELDEMKSRFFANISHEFRSPLTLILGPLKSMYEDSSNGNFKDQFALMIRSAESLLNQINELLDLSKIESGNMKLEASEQDIVKFIKPIAHSFSSLASKKYISYNVNLPNHPIDIFYEKDKLEKVVVNLLSNAFKYTPEFGKVNLSVAKEGKKVVITVQDSGLGIPSDELQYIFDRYYRVNNRNIRTNKGTGIGLSLTKELVELHKGEIKLHSVENEGTTFKVYLSLGKEHLNSTDIVDKPVDYKFKKQEGIEFETDKISNVDQDPIDEFDEQTDSLPVILIVEDNPDINGYIKQVLESNYRILQAYNGLEGLELALQHIPDLIISDIMMPELDGYGMCKKIKSDVKTSHIPVMILTAKASNESTIEGFEIGANYYITKPFSPKLMKLRVRNILKSRDQFKESLLTKGTLNIDPKNVKIASRDEGFLKKAIEIVEKNMSNSEFYVDDLGKELGLSRMQLYRKLKGLIGQSANEFVRSIRLKRAAQLIKQDQLTISEITYEVGFNDLQYFRDCFKKQFGMNPSEYAHKEEENV